MDEVGLLLERQAAGSLGIFEFLDVGEVAVDERGIGQGPQMLGGIEFGGIGQQEQQMDVLRHVQSRAGMPAGTVQDEHDLLLGSGACERCQEVGSCPLAVSQAQR